MRRLRLTPLRLAAAVAAAALASSGVAYAASLGLGSRQLDAWSQPLTKGSCDQTSTTAYDTYVSQKSSSSTFGSATTLVVSGSKRGADYAFVRFDLSGCNLPTTAGADSATLNLYVVSTGNDTISLYPVYTSWDPATLTWNGLSGVTVDPTATTSFTPTGSGFYSIPVTASVDAAIKAGTLWGWELVDTGGTKTASIASAEYGTAADRPSLTLAYEK